MKLFHIGDILSITTKRLVSDRHIDAIYETLNFLTSDELFTHQIPRAWSECEPWIRTQYPQLMYDSPYIAKRVEEFNDPANLGNEAFIATWVESIRKHFDLQDMLPLHAMGEGMHTRFDPIAEAQAMMGDRNVIVVETKP